MAIRTTIDHHRMSGKRSSRSKKLNDRLDEIMMDIEDWIEDLYNSRDPRDKQVLEDLVALANGTGELKLIRFAEANDEPFAIGATSSTPASKRDEWAKVYESDGVTIATDIEKVRWDDTKGQASYGLVPFDDADGTPALKKRPTPAAPTTSDGDRKVPVRDRRNRQIGDLITIAEGRVDPKLEAHIDDTGNVTHFVQKPFIRPRS